MFSRLLIQFLPSQRQSASAAVDALFSAPQPQERSLKNGKSKGTSKAQQNVKKTAGDGRQALQRQKEENLAIQNQWVGKVKDNRRPGRWLYSCLKPNCPAKKFGTRIRALSHAVKCGEKGNVVKKRKPSIRKQRCSICGHEELTKLALTKHRLRHHSIMLKKYRCSRCSKQFVSTFSYQRHVRSHVSTIRFPCSCGSIGLTSPRHPNLLTGPTCSGMQASC